MLVLSWAGRLCAEGGDTEYEDWQAMRLEASTWNTTAVILLT